jgi:RimJ/RimL family protein N-acetyltransferase
MTAPALISSFEFLDAPRLFALIDHELELVEPHPRHIDDLLAACHHPLTEELMPAQAKIDRRTIETFLAQNPNGHTQPDPSKEIAAGYTFWMRVRPLSLSRPLPAPIPFPDVAIAGSISLRIGHNLNLDRYLGHVGYHVLPPARGHHFAERAARLLLPIARAHGHRHLWITCNPDNLASRRTCQRLGAHFIDTVPIPKDNPLHSQGDRQKSRYRLDL